MELHWMSSGTESYLETHYNSTKISYVQVGSVEFYSHLKKYADGFFSLRDTNSMAKHPVIIPAFRILVN